ncbi:MAG: imidazoleglycerol-phosphate dehydratase HisB [bacterium]
MKKGRESFIIRETFESKIEIKLNLDGKGMYTINTEIPFFDHMLSQFAKHGHFNLDIHAKGDIQVDYHHTVEDVGIVLGQAFQEAIGDKKGICRFGEAAVPMDDALAAIVIDICSRNYLVFNALFNQPCTSDFGLDLVEEFFKAFCSNALITMHINLIHGQNLHHIIEAIFKAFGRSLHKASRIDPGYTGIPSTKGIL